MLRTGSAVHGGKVCACVRVCVCVVCVCVLGGHVRTVATLTPPRPSTAGVGRTDVGVEPTDEILLPHRVREVLHHHSAVGRPQVPIRDEHSTCVDADADVNSVRVCGVFV